MRRSLAPEILDELAADDPAAIRSRRDLQRVNWWMGNAAWIAKSLRECLPAPPKRILELGGGDGTLMLQVARRLETSWRKPVDLFLLDRQDIVEGQTRDEFARLGWSIHVLPKELKHWMTNPREPGAEVIIANLFLHHFSDEVLRSLFRSISQTASVFVACEPKRWWMSLCSVKLLWLIGCNHVTRHDARVSIRAGFRDRELSALWPTESGHALVEKPAGLASHSFHAARGREVPGNT